MHRHLHESHGQPGHEQPAHGRLGHGAPVLDIGGDIGALVLYTGPDLEGREIEVSPTGRPDLRTHTEILRRTVGGRLFWAGVYAQLCEGEYQVWFDDATRTRSFTVTGGAVTESTGADRPGLGTPVEGPVGRGRARRSASDDRTIRIGSGAESRLCGIAVVSGAGQ